MPKLTKKAIRYRPKDRRTDSNYRKASLLKMKNVNEIELGADLNLNVYLSSRERVEYHIPLKWKQQERERY